jgi:hypothetical protein
MNRAKSNYFVNYQKNNSKYISIYYELIFEIENSCIFTYN